MHEQPKPTKGMLQLVRAPAAAPPVDAPVAAVPCLQLLGMHHRFCLASGLQNKTKSR